MKAGISQFRTIVTVIVVMIVVSVGFIGMYNVASKNDAEMGFHMYSDISYRTHNPSESYQYAADHVGDQENTNKLLQSLPLNTDISSVQIIDSGIKVNLLNVNLEDEMTQRNILYSAAVIITMVKDVTYVSYTSGTKIIEVTRSDVEAFIPEEMFFTFNEQSWDRVRRAIPEAVWAIIEVRKTTTKIKEL